VLGGVSFKGSFEFVSLSSSLLFLRFATFHAICWFVAFPSSR
jgi:hypothetical protein